MEHYVTLFDSFFLPQGLALHASLERHAGSYTLWVLCVDEGAHGALVVLALPNTRLLRLADWETPELSRVKAGRSRGEYCWTLTPFAPRFVFEAQPASTRVTYIDADMWLCGDPGKVLLEFEQSGKSVLITEHAYSPEHDQGVRSGRYCVQFMTFTRDGGERVRQWWADRCIEWCFNRVEDGKFGDQMYLEDWPQRFPHEVHVLQDKALLQAPWNASRFAASDAIAYHFQGLRLLSTHRAVLTEDYALPRPVLLTHYRRYAADLGMAIQRLRLAGVPVQRQVTRSTAMLYARLILKRLRAWWYRAFAPATMKL